MTLEGSGTSASAFTHGAGPLFAGLDPLGLGSPGLSAVTFSSAGDEAILHVAPFTASVDLGRVRAGSSAGLQYTMTSTVNGPGLNGKGGSAALGDPLDLASNPGLQVTFGSGGPMPVPEPTSLALLGGAAAALAAMRRGSRRPSRPRGA